MPQRSEELRRISGQLALLQQGRCAICDRFAPLFLDHDHDTGAIRGMLCNRCNSGLGLFQDNISALRSAVLYLEHN